MSNVKYYYDSETLTYRPLKKDSKRHAKNTFVFLFAAAFFGFATISVMTFIVISYNECIDIPPCNIINPNH